MQMPTSGGEDFASNFAARLDALFRRIPRERGSSKRFTNETLAAALRERGLSASAGYISHLRTGRKDNPSARMVGEIATAFGVDVRYFYDSAFAEQVLRDLDVLGAARDAKALGVESVLSRTQGLGPDAWYHLVSFLEEVSDLEPRGDGASEKRSEKDR